MSLVSENESTPPSELDLQAFLDNELSSTERLKIIEWLIEHPEDAKRLFEIQLREDMLRTAVWQSINGVDLDQELLQSFRNRGRAEVSQNRNMLFAYGFVAGAIVTAIIFLIF